jgi:hypothetical protein
MPSSAEFAAFVGALWRDWVGLMSGVFGLILTVAGFYWRQHRRLFVFLGEVALVASALSVWTTTYRELRTARDEVSQLKQKLARAERPLVGVVESFLASNGLLAVSFENRGRSPARNVRPDWKVLVNGRETPSLNVPGATPALLMPGVGRHFEAHVSGDDLERIRTGKDLLEVRVEISYADDFELLTFRYSWLGRYMKPREPLKVQQLIVVEERDEPQAAAAR